MLRIYRTTISWFYTEFAQYLKRWLLALMTPARIGDSARAIMRKSKTNLRVFALIDGTIRGIAKPAIDQRAVR